MTAVWDAAQQRAVRAVHDELWSTGAAVAEAEVPHARANDELVEALEVAAAELAAVGLAALLGVAVAIAA